MASSLLFYLLIILYHISSVNSKTFTLIQDIFTVNVTDLNLLPSAVYFADINETTQSIPSDFVFQSQARVKIAGNGVPYHEPNLGGHFRIMVVVDIDSPLSNSTTNSSIAGLSRCISVGESTESVDKAIADIVLTPHLNTSAFSMEAFAEEETVLSTFFDVSSTTKGDSHYRSGFEMEYFFSFNPTDLNPHHPQVKIFCDTLITLIPTYPDLPRFISTQVELRNIFDFQVSLDGCTRIRSVADWEDVSRWEGSDHARFNATFTGNTLSVLSMASGSGDIEIGHVLAGERIVSGTTIKTMGTGSGGIGTYTLSLSQPIEERVDINHGDAQYVFTSGYYPGYANDGADAVILPDASGMLRLNGDVAVDTILMQDGTIVAHNTHCPDGWTVSTLSSPGYKCYKLFEDILDYPSASVACRNTGYGSIEARLVLIDSHEELRVVQGLCRGNDTSNAFSKGCWIGLADLEGYGRFRWEESEQRRQHPTDGGRSAYSSAYYDWTRDSRLNTTISGYGLNDESEKRCVHMVSWQMDPLVQEQGSMKDVACISLKAYVCQMYAHTEKYTLTAVTSSFEGSHSELQGGKMVLTGSTTLTSLRATRSSEIELSSSSVGSNSVSRLLLHDNSIFYANSDFTFDVPVDLDVTALIGGESEDDTSYSSGGQPMFHLSEGKIISIPDATESTNTLAINSRLNLRGTVLVGENNHLFFKQGGDMSHASISIATTSKVDLNDYASRLSSYDAFELSLAHRSAVLGEYTGSASTEAPVSGGYGTGAPIVYGVYKLGVTVRGPSILQSYTQCIPYNATTQELAEALNALSAIADRGNVTVRRTGASDDALYGHGYLYKIELDATPTSYFAYGQLDIFIAGYGLGSGCAETMVSLLDPSGQPACKVSGYSSKIREKSCVIPPDITLRRISSLSYTQSLGSTGYLTVSKGVHRMPPISTFTISASGGRAICGADIIDWTSIVLIESGSLIVTGKGWASWDSGYLLYLPADTLGREWEGLRSVNSLVMTVSSYMEVSGVSLFFVASPYSSIELIGPVNSFLGGTMRGICEMSVSQSITMAGSFKSLQDVFKLIIEPAAEMTILGGNISMSNGAVIDVEGTLTISNTTRYNRVYIGQSNVFMIPDEVIEADEALKALLAVHSKRNWAGYYDNTVPQSEASGWYENPECDGNRCLEQPQINIKGTGSVKVNDNANVTFLVPVNLEDQTRLNIDTYAYTEFMSGGACGGSVILDIGIGSEYQLTGGNFLMAKTCTIRGLGELTSVAGVHTIAQSIEAHITIKGGTLLWPLLNGEGATIEFLNGLLIQGTGILRLEPWSTKIDVYKEVKFEGQCLVQFPVIGTAAQPFLSDDGAPDKSPRGQLRAVDSMIFLGGTLEGKADFLAEGIMELAGGEKNIRNLAKLVNGGLARWVSGDIVMENTADLLNQGKFIQADGRTFDANNFYVGIILPKEQGGDFFAKSYHSYDLDQGSLDSSSYIDLRAESVSIPPAGWSVEDQISDRYEF